MDSPLRQTLVAFIKENKRANCPVCALPEEVHAQLARAKHSRIPRATIIEWLAKEYGKRFTDQQLDLHHRGRHERGST